MKWIETDTLVLELSGAAGHFTVDIYTCPIYLGCVIVERQPRRPKRTISWLFKTLNNIAKNRTTLPKESLPCYGRFYFWSFTGRKFLQHHHWSWSSIICLIIFGVSSEPARWHVRPLQLQFNVAQRAGIEHRATDAQLPLLTARVERPPQHEKFAALNINIEAVKVVYDVDMTNRR